MNETHSYLLGYTRDKLGKMDYLSESQQSSFVFHLATRLSHTSAWCSLSPCISFLQDSPYSPKAVRPVAHSVWLWVWLAKVPSDGLVLRPWKWEERIIVRHRDVSSVTTFTWMRKISRSPLGYVDRDKSKLFHTSKARQVTRVPSNGLVLRPWKWGEIITKRNSAWYFIFFSESIYSNEDATISAEKNTAFSPGYETGAIYSRLAD